MKRPALVVLFAGMVVLGLSACGSEVLDREALSADFAIALEKSLKVGVEEVECPSGLEVENTEAFRCSVVFQAGGEAEFQVRVTPAKGETEPTVTIARFIPAEEDG